MGAKSSNIAVGIRIELRSILRQTTDLRRPLTSFGQVDSRPEGQPRYYVMFDNNPRLVISGLRLGGLGQLSLPNERIIDSVYECAKSLWHLKDRLHQWAKATGSAVDIEAEAIKSHQLLVCADLANWKKHGVKQNRSGVSPSIELVTFDTHLSGGVELYTDGATKHQEVLVEKTVAIPYRVEVAGNNGANQLGNAIDIFERAFQDWLPTIRGMGVLAHSDPESEYLRRTLFPNDS